MTLTHNNVTYEFDYDFAPNDGTGESLVMVVDGQKLDGECVVNNITVNGRPRPVTTEVLDRMRFAAAREELEQNRLAWQQFHQSRAAESRRARISAVPRRD
jgi:hypothetical protein